MKTSRLIERSLSCALLLAAACGDSHTLDAEDFEQVDDPIVTDAGSSNTQRDSGSNGAGGALGGLLDPGALEDLLGGLLTGGQGGAPMGDNPRDGGAADTPDAGPSLCERLPQLPTCPRDAGATDAGGDGGVRDGGVRDGGADGGVSDAAVDGAVDANVEAGADAGDATLEDAGPDAQEDAAPSAADGVSLEGEP